MITHGKLVNFLLWAEWRIKVYFPFYGFKSFKLHIMFLKEEIMNKWMHSEETEKLEWTALNGRRKYTGPDKWLMDNGKIISKSEQFVTYNFSKEHTNKYLFTQFRRVISQSSSLSSFFFFTSSTSSPLLSPFLLLLIFLLFLILIIIFIFLFFFFHLWYKR